MYDYYSMGSRILSARTRNKMKQKELASNLGIAQSTFSEIENGKRDITISQLYILSESLEVSVEWLLGLDLHSGLSDSELLQLEDYKQYLVSKRRK